MAEREIKGVAVELLSASSQLKEQSVRRIRTAVDRWCKVAYPMYTEGNGSSPKRSVIWHLKVWCFDFHLQKCVCVSPFNR